MFRTHLLGLLRAYRPSDEHEAHMHERIVALVETDEAPFARTSFSPGHITASVFITDALDAHAYLIFHTKLQRWLQPGGHVEPEDADILAAARRELYEETNLRGQLAHPGIFDVDVHEIPARKDEPAHEHFDVRFWFRFEDEVPAPTDEVGGGALVPLHAPAEAHLQDESVARVLRKLRAA